MKELLLIVSMMMGWANQSYAQTSCPCCTAEHESFDFWVGDWVVYDTTGNRVGQNTISKVDGNCNVSEHWRGDGGSTGRSFNYFSKTDSLWHQLWIDNGGNQLKLKGKAGEDTMALYGEPQEAPSGIIFKNRVVWILLPDGSVSQVWDIIDEKGEVLQNAFYGIYKKKL